MIIGVPKELKNNENRVAITPAGVDGFIKAGHKVLIEKGAGLGSGFTDLEYVNAGASILDTAEEVWKADMVIKVKEPLSSEYKYFRENLILFTYLHLAAEPELTKALVEASVSAIAYETVKVNNALPLLTPMSEVAGKMSVQIGAHCLEKLNEGKGILLGGVSGVQRSKVTIIGGGIAGTNAAKIAVGMGAAVTIIDLSADRLRQLEEIFGRDVQTLISNPFNIAKAVEEADLVIGSVLIPGAKAPKLVTEEMIKSMVPGSVVVDIAIDQGGCFETSEKVTTHDNPTFVKHGVVHYTVANMPGAVPRTSTIALTNNTIPYALQIANKGLYRAIEESAALKSGTNVFAGRITHEAIARDLNYQFTSIDSLLSKQPI
ncbi:alanine dehydrogenase [Solibacillus sp. FSL R5-0449]|uniref:alanine dehydrogenase n=1 Tax=Solibacillus sp. FSL R5-0449 TaxID=2921639 RepID=UPI0030D1388E